MKYHLEVDRSAELSRRLLQRCMVFGDYTMHSGAPSLWLFDCLKLFEDFVLLTEAMDALNLSSPVAGIEYGGSLLASIHHAQRHSIPILVRKVEGSPVYHWQNPNQPWNHDVTLIDDVVTTGESMRDGKEALEKLGFAVTRQVCILNRSPIYPSECLVTRQEALDYYNENKPEAHRQPPRLL